MSYLAKMTPEQREEAQRKRREKAEYYKSLDTRQEYADENHWRELASKRGVNLPVSYFPAEKSRIRKFLRKIGWSQGDFEAFTGGKLDELIENNPKWSARSLCGVCLEMLEEAND